MPLVTVGLLTGRTSAQKDFIAKGITKTICDATGVKPESIWVLFENVDPKDWYIADDSFATMRRQRASTTQRAGSKKKPRGR